MNTILPAELPARLSASSLPVAVLFARAGSAPSDELVASAGVVERQLAGRCAFLQLDVDEAAALVAELRIHKVPELLVWAPGGERLLARTEGALRPEELADLLEVAATRR